MRFRIPLIANQSLRQFFSGKCLAVIDAGAAEEVTLTLFGTGQQDVEEFGAVGSNFSIFSPDRPFTGAEFTATVDTTLEVIITNYRVETLDGAHLTASIDPSQLPLPVEATRGDAPGNPFYVTGLAFDDTPAASGANVAAVAVNDTIDAIVAADATRLELRFANIGTDPVAIGFVGLTWAQRTIILNPGDTWIEVKGAALAWYGITDAAKSASVTVQELLA